MFQPGLSAHDPPRASDQNPHRAAHRPWDSVTAISPAVRSMRLMGFDVDTFGNHNFDRGIADLQSLIDIASAPAGMEPGEPFQYGYLSIFQRHADKRERVRSRFCAVDIYGVTSPEAETAGDRVRTAEAQLAAQRT